jgi:hypothetical protein
MNIVSKIVNIRSGWLWTPVWNRIGREIFCRSGDKMMAVVIETEPMFRAGKPAIPFEGRFSDPEFPFPQYDVSLDGRSFVMIQESEATQIQVIQTWFEELKKRVPSVHGD